MRYFIVDLQNEKTTFPSESGQDDVAYEVHNNAGLWYKGQPCTTSQTTDIMVVFRPQTTTTSENTGFYTYNAGYTWNVLCRKAIEK